MTAPLMFREHPAAYDASSPVPPPRDPAFPESTLTALWLLGRVPAGALPWTLLRAGRAGRGPGPDVREATFVLESGVTRTGDVEVHLRAEDFVRHGHASDPAYAGVALHLCWEDDRPSAVRGTPTPLPGGGSAPTVALAPLLQDAARVESLVARGPAGRPPCADLRATAGERTTAERVRLEGRRRLAERTWRAWRLVDRYDIEGAFDALLDRALASTAGRVREGEGRRAAFAAAIHARLGDGVGGGVGDGLVAAGLASEGDPKRLIEIMHVDGIGAGRAAELAWNVALPLLGALAAAYDDLALARVTSVLAERWPSPRPYGRTRALAQLVEVPARGALLAQGLLHLQDLWCTRGGCGACPLSS